MSRRAALACALGWLALAWELAYLARLFRGYRAMRDH